MGSRCLVLKANRGRTEHWRGHYVRKKKTAPSQFVLRLRRTETAQIPNPWERGLRFGDYLSQRRTSGCEGLVASISGHFISPIGENRSAGKEESVSGVARNGGSGHSDFRRGV